MGKGAAAEVYGFLQIRVLVLHLRNAGLSESISGGLSHMDVFYSCMMKEVVCRQSGELPFFID
jgi:hypothetical protein